MRWPKPSTILIALLMATIALTEAQRILAQWQAHSERQAQLYVARANGMKLDKVMTQTDLELRLLTPRSTASAAPQSQAPGAAR